MLPPQINKRNIGSRRIIVNSCKEHSSFYVSASSNHFRKPENGDVSLCHQLNFVTGIIDDLSASEHGFK
jgi:hypothetical protein